MIYKIFFSFIISSTISFASYEQVSIGKIDDYYVDKITEQQLKNILDEIEYIFESQLNMNIFDYSTNGKVIDILYVPNSKLEKEISKKMEKLTLKKEKLENLKKYFPKQKNEIDFLQEKYTSQTNLVNQKINILNSYVAVINKKKSLPKNEYNKAQEYVKNEKNKIDIDLKEQKNTQKQLIKTLNNYNQKVFSYNYLIKEISTLVNEIESMSRNIKRTAGRTFGLQEVTLKSFYKDGIEVQEKSIKTNMNKIEIYNFDSLKQLKVVLAHEIAHLVGVPHIEVKGALMNPILQDNQKDNLHLTLEDIENFNLYF